MESEIFIIFAGLLIFFDLIFLSARKRAKPQKGDYGFYLTILGFTSLLIAYGSFLYAFINNDFSLVGIYSYSSSGLSLLSKIYASWGGARGINAVFGANIKHIICDNSNKGSQEP